MVLLLSVLFSLFALLTTALYLLGTFRQRREGEPPLDKGPIPWLGHVLEFRRDTRKFLERMEKKYGDIFTVQLGGIYFTFIQDPLSFGAFVKESRSKLDFNTFAVQLVRKVFGYEAIKGDHQILQASSNKNLMGDGLVVMTQAMMSNLQNIMLHSIGQKGERAWTEDGLFMYSYNIVFRAGYLALFGNKTTKTADGDEKAKEIDRSESDALFSEFRKYDQLFPNLAYGVLPPREKMQVGRLQKLFWKTLSVQNIKTKDNVSGWVSEMHQAREENGMDESMIDRYMFVLLWASQSNTGPSTFWLLLFLMKNPAAMRAVREEVDKVLKETGQEVSSSGSLINLTRDMLRKTPILDSAVEETLRLTTAPLLVRSVVQDMTMPMADGREYRVRKGDRVSIFPYSTVHIDPEVHPDPLTFKYDRFLNPDGSKKTDFYKGGKRMKYFYMPWGAGVSMCPGRFFATNELKQFIFLMLAYFDIELQNPDEEIPNIDIRRWGLGTMQPDRDVQFRYKLRF